ncbi:MAG: carbonic anhydrase [Oscillatoria princeps RMCB-10]|nr:carbonic anhydrase [Oscillatoria princeps RMCB-10]
MDNRKHLRRLSRREMLAAAGGGALAAALAVKLVGHQRVATNEDSPAGTSPDLALQKLMDGNKRFVEEKRTYPDQNRVRLAEVAQGQHPFAIVLGCADSRVPAEILFDQGIGDIFDIRVAGNITDDVVLGSIEYAAEHLGVPLIVVLGHEGCGAVKAALEGKPVPGHIGSLLAAINPALAKAKGQAGDPLDNAVKANVKLVVEQLKSSQPILTELLKEGRLKIVGARYDLDSGKVETIA